MEGFTMQLDGMDIVRKAQVYAMATHAAVQQKRKYTGEPYHTHVLRVAELVSTRTQDLEVLAAACLHDVVRLKDDYGREDPRP